MPDPGYPQFRFSITPDGSGLVVYYGGQAKGVAALNPVPPPPSDGVLNEDGTPMLNEDGTPVLPE